MECTKQGLIQDYCVGGTRRAVSNGSIASVITTSIPQRLDRLPWSQWHMWVVVALSVSWILDGLEVTIITAIGPAMAKTLGLSPSGLGTLASAYLLGTVIGALIFSHLIDSHGRKKVFVITLILYLTATVLTALSQDLWSATLFRFLAGAGIGGEYAAIGPAINELIPPGIRGRISLAIEGSWWLGTAAGSLLAIPLLMPTVINQDYGWRVGFMLGGLIGVVVLFIRRVLPESPRWLITHGRSAEAERIVQHVEALVKEERGLQSLPQVLGSITLRPFYQVTFLQTISELCRKHKSRVLLGASLMVAASVLYNAMFFLYGELLSKVLKVPDDEIGSKIIIFAIGNFLGAVSLGSLFDNIGRRSMITTTYSLTAVLLTITGYLFWAEWLDPWKLTLALAMCFFFASAGGSAAYLTVSEIFPLEIRARAIAIFFALATGIATPSPHLFGKLIEKAVLLNSKEYIFYGFVFCAVLMACAAIVTIVFGVDAERKPLEEIALPMSTVKHDKLAHL